MSMYAAHSTKPASQITGSSAAQSMSNPALTGSGTFCVLSCAGLCTSVAGSDTGPGLTTGAGSDANSASPGVTPESSASTTKALIASGAAFMTLTGLGASENGSISLSAATSQSA